MVLSFMNLQFIDGDHGRPPRETARVSATTRAWCFLCIFVDSASCTDLHVYISIADSFFAKKFPRFANYFSSGKRGAVPHIIPREYAVPWIYSHGHLSSVVTRAGAVRRPALQRPLPAGDRKSDGGDKRSNSSPAVRGAEKFDRAAYLAAALRRAGYHIAKSRSVAKAR